MKNLITLLLVSSVLTACKKEGCTDETATNYDSKSNGKGECVYPTVCNSTSVDSVSVETTEIDGFAIYAKSTNNSNSHNSTVNYTLSNPNDLNEINISKSIGLSSSELLTERLKLNITYSIKTTNVANNVEFDFKISLVSEGIYEVEILNSTSDNGTVGISFEYHPISTTFGIEFLV